MVVRFEKDPGYMLVFVPERRHTDSVMTKPDPKRAHRKMSRNGHFQKVRRPTGLEVYNDAARILEELLERRIDNELRVPRVRRNKTDPNEERVLPPQNETEISKARSKTMPSKYRESKDEELKKKDLDALTDLAQRTGGKDDGSLSSADTDDDQSNIGEDRRKKSLFKKLKERLIHSKHRDEKGDFGKIPERFSKEPSPPKRRKLRKKEKDKDKVVSEAHVHIKGHVGEDKSMDYTEERDYKDDDGSVHSIRKGKSSFFNSFRKHNKKSPKLAHRTNSLEDKHGMRIPGAQSRLDEGKATHGSPRHSRVDERGSPFTRPDGRDNVRQRESSKPVVIPPGSGHQPSSPYPRPPPPGSGHQPSSPYPRPPLPGSGHQPSSPYLPPPPPLLSSLGVRQGGGEIPHFKPIQPTAGSSAPSSLKDSLIQGRDKLQPCPPPPPPQQSHGHDSLHDALKSGLGNVRALTDDGQASSSSASPASEPSGAGYSNGANIYSSYSNILDSPGDDIQYMDEDGGAPANTVSSTTNNQGSGAHVGQTSRPNSGIRYHGSEGLLNMSWLADRTNDTSLVTDFEMDETVVETQRPDGGREVTTTVNATRTVVLPPEPEDVVDGFPLPRGRPPEAGEGQEEDRDTMYSKIAERLIEMADSYAPASDQESRGAAATPSSPPSDFEVQIINCLRAAGDRRSKQFDDAFDGVQEAAKEEAYQRFRSTVQNSIGREVSWDYLAFLFYTTKGVVSAVGKGTKVANQAKEFTLQFITDTCASWIMDQGGFDSMLSSGESDFELD